MSNGHYYDRGENVCVIGAGASGLLATKNLLEHGFGVDCYERETGVGGAWNWRHHRSPVYATAHLISSKPSTQFPDFPMPDSWPDYPHHSQLLSYLERYADHFDLRRQIWFGSEVVRARPVPGDAAGHWDVTTQTTSAVPGPTTTPTRGTERTHRYAAVVVANGHNWLPNLPAYEGLDSFGGEVVHASGFSDPASLRGRRVLVVGAGNTGCDLAVEAAQTAYQCWHSSRRGYWYLPKYLLGLPVDQLHQRVRALRLPPRARQWLFHRMLRLSVGDLTRFGLPKPDHKAFETHPIINSQLVYYLGHGRITPVPEVARFHPDSVELVSGETVEPDLVIFATGYQPRFEFLDPQVLASDETGRPRLRLHAFSHYPTLAVAGLLQSDAGLFSLVHWQTVAVARWLRLRQVDPDRATAFWSWLGSHGDRRWHDAKLIDSPRHRFSTRHWFEVSHDRYLRALQRTLDQLEVGA